MVIENLEILGVEICEISISGKVMNFNKILKMLWEF